MSSYSITFMAHDTPTFQHFQKEVKKLPLKSYFQPLERNTSFDSLQEKSNFFVILNTFSEDGEFWNMLEHYHQNTHFEQKGKTCVVLQQPTQKFILGVYELQIKSVYPLKNISLFSIQDLQKCLQMVSLRLQNKEYMAEKNFRAALSQWQKLPEGTRMHYVDALQLAVGTGSLYKTLMALKCLIEEEHGQVISWCQSILKETPSHIEALEILADLYKESSPEKSRLLYEKLAHQSYPRPGRICHIASCYLENKEYEKALYHYKKALEMSPHHQEAQEGMGITSIFLNDVSTARLFLKNHTNYEKLASYFNKEGILKVNQGLYQEAISLYIRAQEVLPFGLAELFYNLSLAFFKAKQYELSFFVAKLCLIKDPQYEKALKLMRIIGQIPLTI